MNPPPYPNNINKLSKLLKTTGREVRPRIVDEVFVLHGERKLIYFQRFKFEEEDGRVEYRLAYYNLTGNRWVFARNASLIPVKLFGELLAEARKRGWPEI